MTPSSRIASAAFPTVLPQAFAAAPWRLLVLALLVNDGVLVLGTSILDTFDRLEVLEATAEMGLFFTPHSTPRSLPSSARPLLCAGLISSAAVRRLQCLE
jgi:hypothetical protein